MIQVKVKSVFQTSVRTVEQWTSIGRTYLLQWPAWWSQLSPFQKYAPTLAILSYWLGLLGMHGLRGDHFSVGILLFVLTYSGPAGRALLRFGFPFILTLIVYDSQRFYADFIRGPVHISEPYLFDKALFGIQTANGILTPNEWWQLHTHPLLDLMTGFAYLVFFTVYILVSAFFYFYVSKIGTSKLQAFQVKDISRLTPWAFFWLNIIGYSTYHWYAAAPPWYVSLYGLGPVQMDVQANSAGCARFDMLLGTHFFSGMYGRAADVFGAIPSLHVAYPLLAVYFAFQFGTARVFCILFYLLMCFSAVYLNHHYVLDILWGSSYALLVGWGTMQVYRRGLKNTERIPHAFGNTV